MLYRLLLLESRNANSDFGHWRNCEYRRLARDALKSNLRLTQIYRIHSNDDPDGMKWPMVKQWVELVNEASVKFGKEFNLGPLIKDYMSSVGFVDIHEKFVKIPIGPWAKGEKNKEMGVLQREHICDCVVCTTMILFKLAPRKTEGYPAMLIRAKDSYTPKLFIHVLGWSADGEYTHFHCSHVDELVKFEKR